MTMMVPLSAHGKAVADDLVQAGRFASVEEAIEAGLDLLSDEPVDLASLPPEHRAAVEEGLADIEAGRVIDADEVFDRLIAKYAVMAGTR